MLERESCPTEITQDASGAEKARKTRTLRQNHQPRGQNDGASQRQGLQMERKKAEVVEEEKEIQADCSVREDSGESPGQLGDPTSPS